jgi:asparagine synthase (glutamine-hydrolysing)
VLLGAWGARAGELLQRGGDPHREGDLLTPAGPPHGAHGDWRCWVFGEPEAGGKLAEHGAGEAGVEVASVLAQALDARGESAFTLLSGRFAVVAYRRAQNRCLVVRDQLGAQPLVYARVGGGALFAEHEHELLDALPGTPGPDRLALLGWLENGMPPAPRTLYERIERVPPGGWLTLGERVEVERWWQPRYEGVRQGEAPELGERLRAAAFDAVSRAASGARRPAVKLSGGLDSACVAAGLVAGDPGTSGALALGGTFAAHPEADERALIEATACHSGLPLELVEHDPERSMLAPALAHIERWRLPPATPNLFLWQPLLARARELGVDALLDGEGGDEMFGLAAYLIADRLRQGRLAGAWSLSARIPGIGAYPNRRVRLRVLRHYGVRPLVPAAVRRRRQLRASAGASPDALIAPADRASLATVRAAGEQRRRNGPLWWQMQVHGLLDMREQLDMGGHFRREASDAGISIRHPLLHDLGLIETALRLPPESQFDAVRDRPLLRDALRGLIPEEVRARHAKSHFTALVLAGMHAAEAQLIDPLRRIDAPVRAFLATPALDRRLATAPQDRPLLGAGSLWRAAIVNHWLLAQPGSGSPQNGRG